MDYQSIFEQVSAIEVDVSSALLSGLVTVAMCVLVGAVSLSAFQLWSGGDCDEAGALAYVARSLVMLFLLTAMMLYMHQAA
jgi:hypothetical protein